jgi:hypothetical protein
VYRYLVIFIIVDDLEACENLLSAKKNTFCHPLWFHRWRREVDRVGELSPGPVEAAGQALCGIVG